MKRIIMIVLMVLLLSPSADAFMYEIYGTNLNDFDSVRYPDDPFQYPQDQIIGYMETNTNGVGIETISTQNVNDLHFNFFGFNYNYLPSQKEINLESSSGQILSGDVFFLTPGWCLLEIEHNSDFLFDFCLSDLGSSHGAYISGNLQFQPVPEPSTIMLLGTGIVGLIGLGRKKFHLIINNC